ncbi:hypothetical protein ZWY2020_041933 [Hordeum vulgare]|nr:hypothetical protein ZWY2020_041933 [Hordeum vulgare]
MSYSPAVAVASAAVVALALANRVLYKLALVPLKSYPFFLALLTTFGYVVMYFSILYARYSCGAMLPGPAIPILSQSFLVWQLIFSVLLLGKTYSLRQIIGCLLVTSGVVLAVASEANDGHLLSGVKLIWPLLMVISSAFQAGASILKESVFVDGAKRLKGKRPDIFVVNSFGSGFQALFVFLLLPLLSNLRGIKLAELSGHLNGGAECFLNVGESPMDCGGAPFLPLLFIFVNMDFNISLLNLVKMSSAVVASLTATSAVPISIYIISLPLPYIPQGAELM